MATDWTLTAGRRGVPLQRTRFMGAIPARLNQPLVGVLLGLIRRSSGAPSRRRCPDNRQRCRVEEPVFPHGKVDWYSGGLCFFPDKSVVFRGEYNLPVLVTRNVCACVFGDLGRQCRRQDKTCRIFQKPGPGPGIEPVPLVFEAHAPEYRLPVRGLSRVNSVQITP